jgi:hypothetical protein
MALLLAAMIPWSVAPSKSSCSSFLWLVNLGFMLLFCSLFAKTWRVYRIFSGAHLKVVKISNIKLLILTAAVVAFDIILIGVWQGVSPLVPVQYDRIIGTEQHVFTHCSVEPSGAGMILVGLVGAEKAGLLLFGAIMAFSTRNVKGTFNESAAISWSIYNTLMSALIGVAIIVFVSAVEDALILLVLIVLTWIVLSAWGLIFGPKFHLLMQSDEKVIEASRSQITQEKSNGFSFASIAAMTTGQVKQFYVALKLQVNKTERLLQLPQTIFGTGPVAGDHPLTGSLSSVGGRGKHPQLSQVSHSQHKKKSGGGGGQLHNNSIPDGDEDDEHAASSYAVDITPVSKDREVERERGVLLLASAVVQRSDQPPSPSALGGGLFPPPQQQRSISPKPTSSTATANHGSRDHISSTRNHHAGSNSPALHSTTLLNTPSDSVRRLPPAAVASTTTTMTELRQSSVELPLVGAAAATAGTASVQIPSPLAGDGGTSSVHVRSASAATPAANANSMDDLKQQAFLARHPQHQRPMSVSFSSADNSSSSSPVSSSRSSSLTLTQTHAAAVVVAEKEKDSAASTASTSAQPAKAAQMMHASSSSVSNSSGSGNKQQHHHLHQQHQPPRPSSRATVTSGPINNNN